MKYKLKYKILLLIGVIGFILFFPFRFDDDQCCLAEVLTGTGLVYHHHADHEHGHGESVDRHHLVQRYVVPFGLLWWLSIVLGFVSIKQLMKKNVKGQNEHFSKHSPVV